MIESFFPADETTAAALLGHSSRPAVSAGRLSS